MEEKPVLYFDSDCAVCRQLAQFTERRFAAKLQIEGWERNDTIGLAIDGTLLVGDQAWQRLLAIDPHLRGLSWLAEKLGLTQPLVRTLRSSAGILRFLCPSCRRS